jgi:TfoX/Sxy family transcriptional regulator of competence genes
MSLGNLAKPSRAGGETLVDLVRAELKAQKGVEEKKMFGSIGFMVGGKLCISTRDSRIMCRVEPSLHEDLVARSGASPVVMKGREMRGYVYVDQRALRTRRDLRFWVNLSLDYLLADKSSKPKRRASVRA